MRTSLIIFLVAVFLTAFAEPPRKPFVVLRIEGKEYQSGSFIEVRAGQRLSVTAVLLGGRRDYCSNPYKYANVGPNTVITSSGENGMSFYIGDGTFRGTWSLVSEIASFSPSSDVKVVQQPTNSNISNVAIVDIPTSGYGQVFLKVKVTTKWHYERYTQAGRSEQDETNEGDGIFYFKIVAEQGVWYSTANLKAYGNENFSIRNSLDNVQKQYDNIYQLTINRNFSSFQMYFDNLKTTISSLKSTIDYEKSKNPGLVCEITFIGLPTSFALDHLKKIEFLKTKWKEQFLIAQENVAKINEILPKVQGTFSSNILKSIFKNYLNWASSVPTGVTDFLTLYDPSNVLTATAMPGDLLDWYSDALEDASILNNQAKTIKMLSELRKFYLQRMQKSTEEAKKLQEIYDQLKEVKTFDQQLRDYFKTITWAKVQI